MRKLTIMLFTVILAIALVGCGAGKGESAEIPTIPAATEMTAETINETINETAPEVETESITLDDIQLEGQMTPEEQAAAQEKEENEQFLEDSIFKDLRIGFENYGILVDIIGTEAYVTHANTDWDVHTLCANNSFLEEHDVRFNISKGSKIVRYIPPTLESCGYVEDDESTWGSIGEHYGFVWESELDSVTAIRWEGKLTIVIDDKYHIYVNYHGEIPEGSKSYMGIN